MKKLKYALILWVLAVLVAPLGAQGSKESSGPIVLDFPTWQAEEGGFALFWREMVAQFEASHPGVKIQISQVPFNQYHDMMITRFSAATPPDIVHIASRYFDQFASQGWFKSLDAGLAGTDILKNWTPLQSTMQVDGKNQGLLLMGYGFVLYYNEKILRDAGVKVPKDRDELFAAIAKIKALGRKDTYAFGVTTQQHPNVYQDFCNFVYGSGATLIKDGKYNLKDPAVLAGAKDYVYVSSFAPRGVSIEMLRQYFLDGKIAMFIDGPWVASLLSTAQEDLRPYLKLARPPFKYVPGSVSNSLHVASTIDKKKEALVMDFIKQVASRENQLKYTTLTESPAGRTGIAPDLKDPNTQLANALAGEARSILPASRILMMNYSKYVDICVNAVIRLQTEGVPVESVLRDLEKTLEGNWKL